MEVMLKQLPSSNEAWNVPSLPERVQSKDGQIVDTSAPVWYMRMSSDGGKLLAINWKHTQPSIISEVAWYIVKLYLTDRIPRKKAATVLGDFEAFRHFAQWLANYASSTSVTSRSLTFYWSDFTERIARGYLAHCLQHTANKGNYFSRLRTFYRWGVARQYFGFDPNFLRILKSITAVGNLKGHHVRFRHLTKGPFSPDENLLIRRAIEAGKGTDQTRAIVMLHLELGLNPLSTVRLKNEDLKRYETQSNVIMQLDVPRVKKRTADRETKQRPISNKLGKLLENLMQGNPKDPLFNWLSKDRPEQDIRMAMRQFAEAAGIVSPRTGELLNITPRRFRYSLATHMAEEGASKFHIAEILDHTDIQNVDVYVETVSSIAEHVAKATDPTLGPLVTRFLGKVVESSELPAFEGLPNQMILGASVHLPIPLLNVGGVGMCGRDVRKDGLCRLIPPLSCYLCPSFAALRTSAHREMLDSIENFIREGASTMDQRILKQLDDIRIAIKEVLERLGLGHRNEPGSSVPS